MAITKSLGYGGAVSENDVAQWARSFVGSYGVLGPDDWKVTVKTGVDRTVVVAHGSGFGKSIIDVSSGAEDTVTVTTLASGTRWDMIVAHRDSNGPGGVTTFSKVTGVAGGSDDAAFATRKRFDVDLTQDDQPLALVQVTGNGGGGALTGAIIDLRVWQANGGTYASSTKVRQYLSDVGTEVWIDGTLWRCGLSLSGAAAWFRSVPTMLLRDGNNASMPSSAQPVMQTLVAEAATSGIGEMQVNFPQPFAAVPTVYATTVSGTGAAAVVSSNKVTPTSVTLFWKDTPPATFIRVHVLVVGWLA
jgi:hypothetical protein